MCLVLKTSDRLDLLRAGHDAAPGEVMREGRHKKSRQALVEGIQARSIGLSRRETRFQYRAGDDQAPASAKSHNFASAMGSANLRCSAPYCVATLTQRRATSMRL